MCRSGCAMPRVSSGLAGCITVALLAYPSWYGLNGPESVSGVLFAIAPLSGVQASGFFSPGPYETFANAYVRFGGYFGRIGPPPDYVGWGLGASSLLSVVVTRRRPLTWLLVLLTVVTAWVALGAYIISGTPWMEHLWLPWRSLSKLPVLKEILPDQFSPFIALFLAILVAFGLNARLPMAECPAQVCRCRRARVLAAVLTAAVGVGALVPVFITFDMPFTVRSTAIPKWVSVDATHLPGAVGGVDCAVRRVGIDSTDAVAGGRRHVVPAGRRGHEDTESSGGPVDQGAAGSARRLLFGLSLLGSIEPKGDGHPVRRHPKGGADVAGDRSGDGRGEP